MAGQVEFIEVEALPEPHSMQAAELACLAFEDFYGLFSADRSKLIPVIAAQFRNYSELNRQVAAMENNRVVGICSYYPIAEMAGRQIAGVRSLLAVADDMIGSTKLLRGFKQNFADAEEESAYIARLSVSIDKRGRGLAGDLLEKAETVILKHGLVKVRLHVRKDNARALAFYAKAGYAALDTTNFDYILLGKVLK